MGIAEYGFPLSVLFGKHIQAVSVRFTHNSRAPAAARAAGKHLNIFAAQCLNRRNDFLILIILCKTDCAHRHEQHSRQHLHCKPFHHVSALRF